MNHPMLIFTVGVVLVAGAVATSIYFFQDEEVTPKFEANSAPKVAVNNSHSKKGEKVQLKEAKAEAIKPDARRENVKKKTKPSTEVVRVTKPSSDVVRVTKPSFDVVRVTPEGNMVIAGRGEPNSTVAIIADGQFVGQIKPNLSGEWVLVPDEPLSPGSRQLSLEQRVDGEKTETSDDVVLVVVPERKKDIAGRPTQKPSQALALKFPRKGGPSKLLQHPIPKGAARTFAVDTVDYDEEGRLHISGRGVSQSIIQLYLNDKFIGRANVDENNGWRIKPETPVKAGIYQLRADQHDRTGRVSARLSMPFARAEPMATDTMPPEPFLIVQPGNSLWRLARRVYGSGLSYTVIFETNKDQIRNPDLIYPGQVLAVPTTN